MHSKVYHCRNTLYGCNRYLDFDVVDSRVDFRFDIFSNGLGYLSYGFFTDFLANDSSIIFDPEIKFPMTMFVQDGSD
jgi:hypothetical protein